MVKRVTVHRSSVTGKFVPPKYAETHKSTTETERIKKKLARECWRVEVPASIATSDGERRVNR